MGTERIGMLNTFLTCHLKPYGLCKADHGVPSARCIFNQSIPHRAFHLFRLLPADTTSIGLLFRSRSGTGKSSSSSSPTTVDET